MAINYVKKYLIKYKIFLLFIFVFLMFFLWLFPQQDLLGGSGDSNSIWQAIISYFSNKPVTSYVMYKGILSVYPYVWLYRLSQLLNVNNFLIYFL